MSATTIASLSSQHSSNSNTTNGLILDYLFYQSIQARLQKAFVPEERDETTTNAIITKDKNVIESVINGILLARNTSTRKTDPRFEQRLNLCQLTNLAIGHTHYATFSAPIIPYHHNKKHPHQQHYPTVFCKPFQPAFCRSHRRSNCSKALCVVTAAAITNKSGGGPGLAEAIPAFIKTSANMLRSMLDKSEHDGDLKSLRVIAGQQVMGGGLPPRWYDLFLDLLTQAAIQSYMCDGQVGLETIYEIFSYGYVEDEDEEDEVYEDEDDEDDEEEHQDIWSVRAADHHLLFPKTRTMHLFKLQVRQREKEFIQVKEGYTLEKHFMELEKLYPLIYFERNMCDFIHMLLEEMDIPALDKCDIPDIASPIKSPEDLPESQFPSTFPSLYKYFGDGSLLMPEIPDIAASHDENDSSGSSVKRKRSAMTAELTPFEENESKKQLYML